MQIEVVTVDRQRIYATAEEYDPQPLYEAINDEQDRILIVGDDVIMDRNNVSRIVPVREDGYTPDIQITTVDRQTIGASGTFAAREILGALQNDRNRVVLIGDVIIDRNAVSRVMPASTT
jgi:soluble P-type ATPase